MTEKRKKDKMNTEQAIPEPRTESIKKIRRDACISFTEMEKAMRNDCETCVNYVYDEDCEESICTVNLDEDELVRFMEDSHYCCPYYRLDDEYAVVRKQM